jgi:hypothetical protein
MDLKRRLRFGDRRMRIWLGRERLQEAADLLAP